MKRILCLFVFLLLCFQASLELKAQVKCESMGSISLITAKITKAVCVLHATQGNTVSGLVVFTLTEKGINVSVDVQGLSKGKHGFHIHECGDCSAADATSAGGHFNPNSLEHGAPDAINHHAGDLGNLVADETGKAHLEFVDALMTFDGEASIIGRSIIVHQNEDDLKTQPTGNAGPRVACGVIGISK